MTRLFQEGVAAGQFEVSNLDAARVVTIGAMRTAARDVLMEETPTDLTEHVVAMILLSLGMTSERARSTSAEARMLATQFCARIAT